MTATILSLGTSLPVASIDIHRAADIATRLSCDDASQTRKVEALYRRSGVKSRGSVLLEIDDQAAVVQTFYEDLRSHTDRGPSTSQRGDRYASEAPKLAIQSAHEALTGSGIRPSDITHLVTVSCTGFSAPGFDIALIDELGLPTTTERIQVGFMGCHGSINGMRAARGLIAADPHAKVLMTSVELCSLHYQYGFDADRIVSGALFADGSASIVLADSSAHATNNGSAQHAFGNIAATGSCLVPNSREAMTWCIGDNGYEMTLAATVPHLIEGSLKGYLETWLQSKGESIESIQGWAVHPGGTRILSAVEIALELPKEALEVSRGVLAEHGNMSSATMLFILKRFIKLERPKPWLMLGFGPGLEIEVALIK